jgi:hypothetical protein
LIVQTAFQAYENIGLLLNKVYEIPLLIILQLTCGIAGYDYQSVRRWTTFKKLSSGRIDCEKVMSILLYLLPFSPFTCFSPHNQLTDIIYNTNICSYP